MRVEKANIDVFCDYTKRIVHILDLDQGGKSVTNSIDPAWQKAVINKAKLLHNTLDFHWLCYGTDGICAEYIKYNFKFVNDPNFMHQPFVAIMKQRQERLRLY